MSLTLVVLVGRPASHTNFFMSFSYLGHQTFLSFNLMLFIFTCLSCVIVSMSYLKEAKIIIFCLLCIKYIVDFFQPLVSIYFPCLSDLHDDLNFLNLMYSHESVVSVAINCTCYSAICTQFDILPSDQI